MGKGILYRKQKAIITAVFFSAAMLLSAFETRAEARPTDAEQNQTYDNAGRNGMGAASVDAKQSESKAAAIDPNHADSLPDDGNDADKKKVLSGSLELDCEDDKYKTCLNGASKKEQKYLIVRNDKDKEETAKSVRLKAAIPYVSSKAAINFEDKSTKISLISEPKSTDAEKGKPILIDNKNFIRSKNEETEAQTGTVQEAVYTFSLPLNSFQTKTYYQVIIENKAGIQYQSDRILVYVTNFVDDRRPVELEYGKSMTVDQLLKQEKKIQKKYQAIGLNFDIVSADDSKDSGPAAVTFSSNRQKIKGERYGSREFFVTGAKESYADKQFGIIRVQVVPRKLRVSVKKIAAQDVSLRNYNIRQFTIKNVDVENLKGSVKVYYKKKGEKSFEPFSVTISRPVVGEHILQTGQIAVPKNQTLIFRFEVSYKGVKKPVFVEVEV